VYLVEYYEQHQHLLLDKQWIHYQLDKINYHDNQNHDNHEYDLIQDPRKIKNRFLILFFLLMKIHTTIRPRGLVS
jgi:hypothetical protein